MTPAEQLAAERWEAADHTDCTVVVEGTGACVAVMGNPFGNPTPADRRRFPLVAAAPALLAAVLASRRQFALYAEMHRAKGTDDGARKAETNETMVALCDQVIAAATMVPAGCHA